MKQYVLFIAMALLAIQFQSCSSGDDNLVSSDELLQSVPPPTLSRAEILDGIQKGRISGGGNTVPKERTSFYTEYMPEVDWVSALGTFTARDEKGVVEVHDNLGGGVQTKEGGSFVVTYKGKSMHVEGSGITHPLSGFTYHTTLSLDIDDASLIESSNATITSFSLTTNTEVSYGGETTTGSVHLAASNIPMISDATIYTHWKGGVITDYSWSSGKSSLTLVDNPSNYLEVWITFKEGTVVKARIGGS